jgi:hypothetical protein
MSPNQISTSIMADTKSDDAIESLANLTFGNLLLPALNLVRDVYVNFLDMSEEYKQICIKHTKLLNKICFFERPGKTKVDRCPSWSNVSGKLGPDGCDHAQKLALIKLEHEITRRDPHYVCGFEDRLEADTLFSNIFAIGLLGRFGTLIDGADSFDVVRCETYFVAVDTKTTRYVGEA